MSIKAKVLLVLFAGMSGVMVIILVNLIALDYYKTKTSLLDELQVIAEITARRSNAALAFRDKRRAAENLNTLLVKPNIQMACIYSDVELFANAERQPGSLACPKVMHRLNRLLGDKYFYVVSDIKNQSLNLGKLIVVSDYSPMWERLSIWLGVTALVIVLTVIGVFAMINRMQAFILDPLQKLGDVMNTVKEENNLSLRADKGHEDEIGRLIDAFNEMLALIESGNMDFAIVYDELVKRSTEAEASAVELEARNEEIKGILSGAAHDLRQPLQAMAIFIDLLQIDTQSDDQKNELLTKLKASQENMNAMFSEILDASRLEHKPGTADIQSVALHSLFGKLQSEFSALALEKNLHLRVNVRDLKVDSVPGVLERIIRNLVSNAIRYTSKGGVLISARARKDETWIEIWDTGCGIAEENIDHIFHQYEQLEDAKYERGSYGLGLAIVKNFINVMGYELVVKSKLGQGSCFRIVLPSISASEQPALNRTGTSVGVNEGDEANEDYDHVLQQMLETNVILVDDDNELRAALKMLLESWDIHVHDFESLDAVQAYFESGDFIDPDAVISDFQLGNGVTGDEVIAEVRLLSGVEVPALVITGANDQKIKDHVLSLGYEYLAKPLDPTMFNKIVRSMCDLE